MERLTLQGRRFAGAVASAVLLTFLVWAVGTIAELIHVPVPWLLGPLAAGVILRFALPPRIGLTLPGWLVVTAQAGMGLSIGLASDVGAFRALEGAGWVLALVGLVPLVISMLGGFALAFWAGVDPASGFLGSIPGAASGIVAMSSDLGADARVVAVLQYLRVLIIAAVAPLVVTHLPGTPIAGVTGAGAAGAVGVGVAGAAGAAAAGQVAAVAGTTSAAALGALGLVARYIALILGTVVVVRVGRWVRLPSPAFLAPLALGLVLAATVLKGAGLPAIIGSMASGLIGYNVGAGFDRPTISRLRRAALVETAVVVLLLVGGGATGYLLNRVAGVGLTTALLGAAPGAMDIISAATHGLGADAAIVAALHLVRFLMAAIAGPWIAMLLVRRMGRRGHGTAELSGAADDAVEPSA